MAGALIVFHIEYHGLPLSRGIIINVICDASYATIALRAWFLQATAVRSILALILLCLFIPPALAEQTLTRRQGFLLVWESVRRQAETQVFPEFADILEGYHGFTEISYARERGILDEATHFRPDEALLLEDAILWLFRTRNVADLSDMERTDLPALLERYPIADANDNLSTTLVTQRELFSLIARLDQTLSDEVHTVSFYADDFHGRGTAFGETFDMHALTAAHRTLPYNTMVKVLNVENGQSVTVRINDRGPYVDGRDMDLSLAAFEKIADRSRGVLRARFLRLGDRELIDACTQQVRRFQKRITRDVRFHRGVPHFWQSGDKLSLGANRAFVVRRIRYPDGNTVRVQDWVLPKERFHFTPGVSGLYTFTIGTTEGRQRELKMTVHSCGVE